MAFPIYDAPNPLDSILGRFNTDDPAKQARLAQSLALLQAGGPSRTPVSLFQGLGMAGQAGLEAKRQAQKDAQAKLLQDMQLQQFTSQQDELKRKRTQQDALANLWGSSITPGGPGMPANEMDSGMDMGQRAPQFDRQKFIQGLGAIDPMKAFELSQKPEDEMVVVGGNLVNKRTGEVRFAEPAKPEKPLEIERLIAARNAQPPNSPTWKILNDAITKQTTHQPGTRVDINTGQKGYENESKLRNDFRSEPIYKDFNDMLSSHKQIKVSLQQETPIGDTAAATKIMKLLDPGSVVRESELGIAMAAAGKMDRLENLVDMWKTGKKLTPTQRVEFGVLADELVRAAGQAYNNKRMEYESLGKRYQLDTGVLGSPFEMPKTSAKPATGKAKFLGFE